MFQFIKIIDYSGTRQGSKERFYRFADILCMRACVCMCVCVCVFEFTYNSLVKCKVSLVLGGKNIVVLQIINSERTLFANKFSYLMVKIIIFQKMYLLEFYPYSLYPPLNRALLYHCIQPPLTGVVVEQSLFLFLLKFSNSFLFTKNCNII